MLLEALAAAALRFSHGGSSAGVVLVFVCAASCMQSKQRSRNMRGYVVLLPCYMLSCLLGS